VFFPKSEVLMLPLLKPFVKSHQQVGALQFWVFQQSLYLKIKLYMQKTFLMIKPDAVERNLIGEILRRVEKSGFEIMDLKMLKLSLSQAKRFYQVHRGKPFFDKLVKYVSSGKVVVALLKKKHAVKDLRELIGSTDPKKAKKGTIRRDLAINTTENSVHASDSPQNAKTEIEFFFTSPPISPSLFHVENPVLRLAQDGERSRTTRGGGERDGG
jgi:nucleoside-diphosphate kinase